MGVAAEAGGGREECGVGAGGGVCLCGGDEDAALGHGAEVAAEGEGDGVGEGDAAADTEVVVGVEEDDKGGLGGELAFSQGLGEQGVGTGEVGGIGDGKERTCGEGDQLDFAVCRPGEGSQGWGEGIPGREEGAGDFGWGGGWSFRFGEGGEVEVAGKEVDVFGVQGRRQEQEGEDEVWEFHGGWRGGPNGIGRGLSRSG